jgi:hypothetical protein
MVPVEQVDRWQKGRIDFLQMLFEKMVYELDNEASKLNVTEGEWRVRLELINERSSLNPGKPR